MKFVRKMSTGISRGSAKMKWGNGILNAKFAFTRSDQKWWNLCANRVPEWAVAVATVNEET